MKPRFDMGWATAAAVLARNAAKTCARLAANGVTCTVRFELPTQANGFAPTQPSLVARPDLATLVRRRGGPL
jgi:hypothetical protein